MKQLSKQESAELKSQLLAYLQDFMGKEDCNEKFGKRKAGKQTPTGEAAERLNDKLNKVIDKE